MRKFSSINESFDNINKNINVKRTTKTIDEVLLDVINECIGIQTEDIDNAQSVEGKTELIEKLKTIVEDCENQHAIEVNEKIRLTNKNYYDEKMLLEQLNIMEKRESEFNVEIKPETFFNKEDFTKEGDTITLHSLTAIPDVFVDYIKFDSIRKYFQNDTTVNITYIPVIGIWKLDFVGDEKVFGISVTKDEERHLMFINANIKFIDSFYDACCNMLGKSKVSIVDPILRDRLRQQ